MKKTIYSLMLLLLAFAGFASAQTPTVGTFTSNGSPVANGSIIFRLQNCGGVPTAGTTTYTYNLNASGVLASSPVQGNAGNGCAFGPNSTNLSYFEVTLQDKLASLVWRRYFIVPVQATAWNVSTATSLTTLPASVGGGASTASIEGATANGIAVSVQGNGNAYQVSAGPDVSHYIPTATDKTSWDTAKNAASTACQTAGCTMSGPIELPAATPSSSQAAPRKYVDDAVAAVKGGTPGGTNTGSVQYRAANNTFGGDGVATLDGNGNFSPLTVSGISYLNKYGTSGSARSLAFSTACSAVATTQGCSVFVAPSDYANGNLARMLGIRPYSGGSVGSNYFGVQVNGNPFSEIQSYQGMLGLRSSNPTESQGTAIVVNVDRTHRVSRGTQDFQINSVNSYGQQHGSNRDNMAPFSVNATSKGAQLGGVISLNASCYGEGDCVLNTYNGVTNGGAVDGDQEGLEIQRGTIKAATSRFTATTTSAATLNTGAQLYAVNTGLDIYSNGGDPLGLWQTILNLSSSYNTGGIARFQQNTTLGGVKWITATGDATAGFLAKYGASLIQPITNSVTINAVNPTESLGTRVSTTVTVASTSGYPSSGICSVVGQLTYEPGVPFSVVDSTHITINTYGDHYTNDLIVYGGATGLALSMDADIIPAGSAYGNNVPMRTHTTRIIGTTETGDLILWNTGKTAQNGFNTKALLTTNFPSLTVTPTISGGTITSATITESGDEYLPVNRVIADSGSTFYSDTQAGAPVPTVTTSAGCDAVLSVAYYKGSSGGIFLGTPSTTDGIGGTKNVQITNGGTTCNGATVTIQNTFPSNPYHIYDFAVIPTFNYTDTGDGTKMLNVSTLYLALQNPSKWPSGSSLASEVWPHIRVQYGAGFTVQNYHDGGGNITWMPYSFDGLRGADAMVGFVMGDAVAVNGVAGPRVSEFAQRGLPVIPGVQGFRSPAGVGMRVYGNFVDTLQLSAPNGGALFGVGAWGYKSPANLQRYSLFGLQTIDGSYKGITFDPVSNTIGFNTTSLTNSSGLSVFPAFVTATAGQTITVTSFMTLIDCNGLSFNITTPVPAGSQIQITNTSSTGSCTVNATAIGNSFQTSSWGLPIGTSLTLYSTSGRLRYINPAGLTTSAIAVAGTLSNSTSGNAATADALTGTVAWSIPYQSASKVTSYVTPTTNSGWVFTSNGNTTAPSWQALPTASSTVAGLAKVDGTSITAISGILSLGALPTGSSTAFGAFKVDGTSIKASSGVLSIAGDQNLNSLTLASDPSSPYQASTKQYVDNKLTVAYSVGPITTSTSITGSSIVDNYYEVSCTCTISLPAFTTVGQRFSFINVGTGTLTLSATNIGNASSSTSDTVAPGTTGRYIANGTSAWRKLN